MPTKLISIEVLNVKKPKESILTALRYIDKHISTSGVTRSRIECICKCGKIKNAIVCDFLRGNPLSCGCKPYKSKPNNRNKRLHKIWYDMISRCNDLGNKYYGGKGVKVCNEWNDYNLFAEWAINNGYHNKAQIDKDINGNGLLYSPQTCIFVTAAINISNRSTSKKYSYNSGYFTLSEIAQQTGIPYHLLKGRIYVGKKTLGQAISMGFNP